MPSTEHDKKYSHKDGYQIIGSFFSRLEEDWYDVREKIKTSKYIKILPFPLEHYSIMLNLVHEMHSWYDFFVEWQASLIRTKLCSKPDEITKLLLSPLDLLVVGINFLECRMASWNEDHSVLVVIMEKIYTDDPLYKSCLQLWREILEKFDLGEEKQYFNEYQYEEDIYYQFLPPQKDLFNLSQNEKDKVRNLVSRTKKIIERCSHPDVAVKRTNLML